VEQWKPVVGFEDYYEVSDQGRVRSLLWRGRQPLRQPRLRKLRRVPRPRGGIGNYLSVNLCVDRSKYIRFVHVLVLEAFVGPRPPRAQTRHKNGVPDDNRVENLQWGTPRENVDDALRHGTYRRGSNHSAKVKHTKLSDADVVTIRAARQNCVKYRDLAQQFNVAPSTIWYVVKRGWAHV
jgi:hypothetical protein